MASLPLRVIVVAATVLAVTAGTTPAFSSTDPAGGAGGGSAGVRLLSARLPVPSAPVTAVWGWPRGRRLYQLGDLGSGTPARLVAYDAEKNVEVAATALNPRAWYFSSGSLAVRGATPLVAVDDQQGRVFVVHRADPPSASVFAPTTSGASLGQGQACVHAENVPCMGGVHVLDAATLEPLVAPMVLRTVQGDAPAGGLVPRAIAYAPPRGEGDGGKLLVLVEELATHTSTSENTAQNSTRAWGALTVYAVQFDPVSGRQEWMVRVDGCRAGREARDTTARDYGKLRPNPAAIYRSPSVADPAVVVGCHQPGTIGTVVRVPLDEHGFPATPTASAQRGAAGVSERGVSGVDGARVSGVVAPPPAAEVFPGPENVTELIADPRSDRVLMRVETALSEVWWVFDARVKQYVGTIGIGRTGRKNFPAGIDLDAGRLYELTNDTLFMADFRRTPLPQALTFPAPGWVNTGGSYQATLGVLSAPAGSTGPRRIYVNQGTQAPYRVIEEDVAVSVDAEGDVDGGRTLDLDEVEGVTAAVPDGAARGYGARLLLIGGADTVGRVGPVDPMTAVYDARYAGLFDSPEMRRIDSPCTGGNRDVTFAAVGPQGPAVVDGTGARGAAEPVSMDSATRADLEAAVSRCSGTDWEGLWGSLLLGRAPTDEPKPPRLLPARMAECAAKDDATGDSVGDPVAGVFAARVNCSESEGADGFSYMRGIELDGVSVAEAVSSFRIYRDARRGIVSRVESVARGVTIDGVVRITGLRGAAESWANGRRQRVAAADREPSYVANCDLERTAGTCFQRQVFGVWTPGYSCGPCGNEDAVVAGISRALGANAGARFRAPDAMLARGSENGFTAAVQKPAHERFADLVLNNDLLQTVVPTLEIVRYTVPGATPAHRKDGSPDRTRGRQVVQLAGVEVSSSYAIQCLLVYDEQTNTCAAAREPGGSITLSLSDTDSAPLAGGAFEIRADVDTDGLLGLKDPLVPGGACLTADDGVGTCRFDDLAPGPYLVSQVAAPPGYAKAAEPFLVDLGSGEARTVAFTNASTLSAIRLTVTDDAGALITGAAFAAYPDPDADGKISPDTAPAATCTTDTHGVCAMSVAAGSYVLVQTTAPAGLAPIDPVAVTFASGGQTAAVTVVNYPPDTPAAPAGPPAPAVAYQPAPALPAPTVSITDHPPATTTAPTQPAPAIAEQLGGTITRVIRGPGDAVRLLSREPKQAIAWTAAITLFALAALTIRRRQQTLHLLTNP